MVRPQVPLEQPVERNLAEALRDRGLDLVGSQDFPGRYLNRELQWLRFNERVLAQASDDRVPLLERVRFLAIHANNLDEFFMRRIGGLRRQLSAGVGADRPEDLRPAAQLKVLRARLIELTRRASDCYQSHLLPSLDRAGVTLVPYSDLSRQEGRHIAEWYRKNAFPMMTPLAVDPGHRIPSVSNLTVWLTVTVRAPGEVEYRRARIKIPQSLPQWVRVGSSHRYVALRDIVEQNLADLFPGMDILSVLPFRITRNADVADENDDAEDLLEAIHEQLRRRKFAPVVRLQIGDMPDPALLEGLCDELEIHADDVYETHGLIELGSLHEIANIDLRQLRYANWVPATPPSLASTDNDIFKVIRKSDILLHHPYESFEASVERFIQEAAADPDVLSIKLILYRTSGESPFVHELIRAAEAGKLVTVVVEVRARFDEARNIEWARTLEDAGVQVVYGADLLKTHAKIAIVTRRETGGVNSYVHLATGNYNSKTAVLYEDLGLLTCDPLICNDVINLFNGITGHSHQVDYHRLLVAPAGMKSQFIESIEREIEHHASGRPCGIVAKMNQLEDRDVIDTLYRASQSGVPMHLIVRGFCTLRPGVKGLSETISVCSIIGRFLEHSRIYHFRNGADDPVDGRFLIGSADWMHRNLGARVEAVCPIEDRSIRQRLWKILVLYLNDQRQCWDMLPDGNYMRRDGHSADGAGVQELLMASVANR